MVLVEKSNFFYKNLYFRKKKLKNIDKNWSFVMKIVKKTTIYDEKLKYLIKHEIFRLKIQILVENSIFMMKIYYLDEK